MSKKIECFNCVLLSCFQERKKNLKKAKKRRGNKDDSKSQKKKKKTEIDRSKNDQITIEEIFARFPHLSEAIFVRLDDRSLASCREVNKTWQEFVDSQRIYWIRKILKYANPRK